MYCSQFLVYQLPSLYLLDSSAVGKGQQSSVKVLNLQVYSSWEWHLYWWWYVVWDYIIKLKQIYPYIAGKNIFLLWTRYVEQQQDLICRTFHPIIALTFESDIISLFYHTFSATVPCVKSNFWISDYEQYSEVATYSLF